MRALFDLAQGPQHSAQSLAQSCQTKTRRHERKYSPSPGQSLRSHGSSLWHGGRGAAEASRDCVWGGLSKPKGPITRGSWGPVHCTQCARMTPSFPGHTRGLCPDGWQLAPSLRTEKLGPIPKGQSCLRVPQWGGQSENWILFPFPPPGYELQQIVPHPPWLHE